MAQFLRPISNTANTTGGVTGTWADIDESTFSDSDYVYGTNNSNEVLECLLSTGTDPAVGTGHIMRWRQSQADSNAGTVAPSSGGTASNIEIDLYQGITLIATGLASTASNEGSFLAGSYTLSAAEANAITDYSDLRLHVFLDGSGGSPANRRSTAISWFELEIPDAPAGETLQLTGTINGVTATSTALSFKSTTKQATGTISGVGSTSTALSTNNLANNGTFESGTGWDVSTASWSISGGLLTNDGTGQFSVAAQYSILEVGKTYRVQFTVTGYNSGTVRARCGDTGVGTNRTGNGTYTEDIVCATNGHLGIQCVNFFDGSVDNVIVLEVANTLQLTATANGVTLNTGDVGFKSVKKHLFGGDLGAEIVTNGSFDSNVTGWNISLSTLTWNNGVADFDTSNVNHNVHQQCSVESGEKYVFTFKAKRGTITALKYSAYDLTNFAEIIAPTSYTVGDTDFEEASLVFTTPATCTTANVYPVRDSGVTGTAFFDDASLKKMLSVNGVSLVNGDLTIATGGTTLQLTATANGVTSNTSDLSFKSVTKQLSTTVNGSSSITSDLTFASVTFQLTSITEGVTTLSSQLSFAIQTKQVTSSLSGVSDVSGVLSFVSQTKQITSSADGVSLVVGDLGFATNKLLLSATVNGIADVVGDVGLKSQTKQVTGTTDGASSNTATLNSEKQLFGTSNGVSLVSGDISFASSSLQISGTINGVADVIGDISFKPTTKQLVSSTDGVTLITGAIDILSSSIQLTGTTNGVTDVSGALTFDTQTKTLSSTSNGVSLVNGSLTLVQATEQLTATISGVSLITGSIDFVSSTKQLTSNSNGVAVVSGALDSTVVFTQLSGSINGVTDLTADVAYVQTTKQLTTIIGGATLVSGALTATLNTDVGPETISIKTYITKAIDVQTPITKTVSFKTTINKSMKLHTFINK